MAYKYMHDQICMHDILHTSPRKMTFVPDRNFGRVQRSFVVHDVVLLRHTKSVHAHVNPVM